MLERFHDWFTKVELVILRVLLFLIFSGGIALIGYIFYRHAHALIAWLGTIR